jgi:ATP-binding cassette subfamily F protein uup
LGDIGKILGQYQHLIAKGELDQATKLQEKIDQLDAWQYLHKIETILQRFTLSPEAILSTLSSIFSCNLVAWSNSPFAIKC